MKPGESAKQTETGEETDVWNGQNGEGPDVQLPPHSFRFNPVALATVLGQEGWGDRDETARSVSFLSCKRIAFCRGSRFRALLVTRRTDPGCQAHHF